MTELHGGNIYRHPGCYDFSANLNPLGMPDSIRKIVAENVDLWEHYPDPFCTELRQKIARTEQVAAAQIVCGNGADDLIWRIIQAIQPKRTLLFAPTFSEYRRALTSTGCAVETVSMTAENGFAWTESMLSAFCTKFDLAILCNPNNPTGQLVPAEWMAEICRICEKNGTFLLSDECFLDFTADRMLHSARRVLSPHRIVLNAFTKTYAIPGLRLGYAIFGNPALAERVQQTGQHWSVSTPAQCAGLAALDETAYLKQSQQLIAEERRFLMEGLQMSGIKVFPSAANFILFQAKTGLFQKMLAEHFLIRSCENFKGLDGTFYRIAVRTHEENQLLLQALRRCL